MATGYDLVWDEFEDEQIKLGYETGEKVYAIAHRLHRNYGQIAARARALGVKHRSTIPDPHNTYLPGVVPLTLAEPAGVVLRCFRERRMDTLDIARFLRMRESTVVTLLHAAREAEHVA